MSGRALGAVLALALVSHVRLIFVEAYDPDEFEHLHAGLMFAEGLVPYRDFFEHHGPLPYLIAWLPAKVLGPTTALLTVNRFLSLAFVVATCWATYRLAVRVAGKRAAPWSLVWLVTLPWFSDKSLEWRPDVPAMAFVTLAALAASRLQVASCGLLVGLATLCTPKAAALGLGILLALLARLPGRRRTALWFAGGFAVPWVVAAAAFAAVGGLKAFGWCLFYVPAVWPMRVWVGKQLFAIALEHGPASLAVGIAAWFSGWAVMNPKSPRALAWDAVRIPVLLHWLSWPFVPAAYLQFHLLGLPLLGVGVGRFLRPAFVGFGGLVRPGASCRAFRPMMIALIISMLVAPPWANGPPEFLGFAATVVALGLMAVRPLFTMRRKRFMVGLVVALALGPNLAWFWVRHVVLPNAPVNREMQLAAICDLGGRLPNAARVQDGFTGVGCLHQRADYWWWINEHSLALMERVDDLKGFRARLREKPPEALLVDVGLRQALMPIREEIERGYRNEGGNEALRYQLLIRRE